MTASWWSGFVPVTFVRNPKCGSGSRCGTAGLVAPHVADTRSRSAGCRYSRISVWIFDSRDIQDDWSACRNSQVQIVSRPPGSSREDGYGYSLATGSLRIALYIVRHIGLKRSRNQSLVLEVAQAARARHRDGHTQVLPSETHVRLSPLPPLSMLALFSVPSRALRPFRTTSTETSNVGRQRATRG